jgi:LAO/AO transport system kinase
MSVAEDEPDRLFDLLRALESAPRARVVLGITGAPGTGKSLLVDRLVGSFREWFPERCVGVIAADPSSPYGHGALLGDRVRMMRHATDPNVFIRSVATRGHLGGLTPGVFGIVRIMGLLGCDLVVLETVGVGQSEVEIDLLADLVAVVLAPGQGDTVQFLKSGLMEAADLFVVNKADLPGAASFHAQLTAALHLREQAGVVAPGPPVFSVSARRGDGVADLIGFMEQQHAEDHENWTRHRAEALTAHLEQAVMTRATSLLRDAMVATAGADPLGRLLRGEMTIDRLVGDVIRRAAKTSPSGGPDGDEAARR